MKLLTGPFRLSVDGELLLEAALRANETFLPPARDRLGLALAMRETVSRSS